MKIIGITGPSGAGKSSLTDYFSAIGLPVINADEVYHSLLLPPSDCLNAIRDAFGDSVFTVDGELDRKALSLVVFNDEGKLKLLNSTVLHFVLDEIRGMIDELDAAGKSAVIVDAPTLIESGFHKECDTVVSVLCPPELRIRRIIERDGIDKERAVQRTMAQKPDDFYVDNSHFVIVNDGDKDSFEKKIRDVAERMGING